MDMQSFLSEELWLFLLLAIFLGLVVPEAGLYVTPYSIYLLLVVMFLTSLGIHLEDIKKALAYKRLLLVSLLLVFVVSPVIAFFLSFTLEKELAVGLILYSAIPSAMANAFYIRRFGGDAALALVITTLTTLMAPFVTPIIVKILTGAFVDMNPLDLFFSLVKLIILPFGVAEIVRRYAKPTAEKLLKHSAPITNVCIFFVVLGVISSAAGEVWELGWLAIVMAIYLAICFSLGYISTRRHGMVLGFGNGFRNGTLAMVVALEVFGPTAALIGVMSTLVHNSFLVPMMFWNKKKS